MVTMICLANSWRPGGRCVAGIDVDSGKWVRPVPPRMTAIPECRIRMQGRNLALLDVIELDLAPPTFTTRFQCENRLILNWNWRRIRVADMGEVLKYVQEGDAVLYTRGKVVEPARIERLPPEKWASLQLVHGRNVSFEPDPRDDHRWQARFSTGGFGQDYLIKITDPIATVRLNSGRMLAANCLLTISLTEPIQVFDKPELCYKLAAGILEIPP